MTTKKIVWALATVTLLLCSPASASHKAWVLKQGGGECAFQSPQFDSSLQGDGGDLVLSNRRNYSRTAVCPIVAAGRWGSSGTTAFGVTRWAEAKRAWVHVYNGHSTAALTCQAVARLRVSNTPGGSLYFGTARSVTGQGYHTIELVTGVDDPATHPWTTWGGSLETNEGARIRSLDFQCTLPANAGNPSNIRGFGVATCQKLQDCYEFGLRNEAAGNEVSIQGNGASCSSQHRGVFRGADGLATSLGGATPLVCPIIPPSQDSYEHGGFLKRLRVYYAGAVGSPGCEGNGTCPNCFLRWERATDGLWRSSNTFVWNAAGYLEMPQTANGDSDPNAMSVWSTAGISCWVPSGQRIRGYTAWASQTKVTGGD
jgi:hypothetical protein